ncbi:MAG: histidine phosphatase family protein [Candidatus Methylomirabilales bacterium]
MAEHRPELWLIRHGETEWTATGQHTGRTDIPLTALGRRQATALGRRLADRVFDLVLVSPLTRALETCRIAGYGEVAKYTDDLREWDYGAYEGRTTAEIRTEVPGWTIWTHDLPGGETIEQVAGRVGNVIGQATAAGGDVALFAHGHVLRVLAAFWLGLPPDAGRLLGLGTASLSVLGYERETRIITTWNQDWHLVRKEDP